MTLTVRMSGERIITTAILILTVHMFLNGLYTLVSKINYSLEFELLGK
jgi:hypothetical protein